MARVLAISSQVARGHVGLSAMVPALQVLGHEVTALPTILLSNHPGHSQVAGQRVDPELLTRMLEALAGNGWLAEVDAVVTGYLPTAAHVRFAVDVLDRLSQQDELPLFIVDPVLGDDPKGVYIDAEAAAALRADLVPLADIVTPNRFELAWLTGREATDQRSAVAAMEDLETPIVLATSIPEGPNALVTIARDDDGAYACSVRRRGQVPNGTGDLLTAIFAAHCLDDATIEDALGSSVAAVLEMIAASQGRDELALPGHLTECIEAAPLPVIRL